MGYMACLAQQLEGTGEFLLAACLWLAIPALFAVLGFVVVLLHVDRWRMLSVPEERVRAGLSDEAFAVFAAISRKAYAWATVGGALLMGAAPLFFYSGLLQGPQSQPSWLVSVTCGITFLSAWVCLFVGAILGSRAKRYRREHALPRPEAKPQ
jgi:hypothetical protein